MKTNPSELNWKDLTPDDLPGDLQEIAEDCGLPVAKYLVEVWGGAMIYIPTLSKLKKSRRDRMIVAEHNGRNEGRLAARYGISRRYIKKIIKRGGRDEKDEP